MAYNAADRNQVKSREAKERRLYRKYLADLRDLLKLPAFRRVLWRLIEHAGALRSDVILETNALLFNEGRRNVGAQLMRDVVEAEPTAMLMLWQEATADELRKRHEEEQEDARLKALAEARGDSPAEETEQEN